MSICLSHDEIVEITHKQRHSAQARVLVAFGYDFHRRPDGSIMILRQSYEAAQPGAKPRTEPNWSALTNASQAQ